MVTKKMLFFDIECANTFDNICKMCSFGYIVTDDEFNIIEQDDIIIDPEDKFDWYLFSKKSSTRLAYKKEVYYSKDNFVKNYERISEILKDEYIGIFGFSVSNDLKFIYDSCIRYDLSHVNIKAFDIQMLLKENDNDFNGSLIINYKKEFPNSDKSDIFHNSIDDAIMTMELLRNLCEKNNESIYDLLHKTNVKVISFVPNIKNHTKSFLKKYREKTNNNPSHRKYSKIIYNISELVQEDIILTTEVVNKLFKGGAVLKSNTNELTHLIALDENNKKELINKLNNDIIQVVLLEEIV